MPSIEHLHSWVRYKERSGPLLKDYWFRCDHPECTAVQPAALVLGKKAACSACGAEYILAREQGRRQVRPKCLNCADTKEARMFRKAQASVAKILGVGAAVDIFSDIDKFEDRKERTEDEKVESDA